MSEQVMGGPEGGGRDKLLPALERLMEIEATDVKGALAQASQMVAEAVHADKVDAFLHDPSIDSLVAVASSNTPMARRQREIGLDRLPVFNRGKQAEVYETGEPYINGRADEDPAMLPGYIGGLGVRSVIDVPMDVAGERRGVLEAVSASRDAFTEEDLHFLAAVARWVGMVAHRGELVERIARDAADSARRLAAEELVTVLAHDFGNHLMPLKARIDLIRRSAGRGDCAKSLQHAAEAKQAVARLERLTGDLLDVARLEQGVLSLARQPVDLAELVQETTSMLGTDSSPIRVRVPEELVVEADPQKLRQALENLVSNAQKHSPDGAPVAVEVGEQALDSGQWAVIEVQDEGPGIPADLLPRLFTRFGAGPDSTGLGLGLFLARGIADAHGGELAVQSSPGKGASFRLSLPIR